MSYVSFNHGRDRDQLKKINSLVLRPQNKKCFYCYLTNDFFDESLKIYTVEIYSLHGIENRYPFLNLR